MLSTGVKSSCENLFTSITSTTNNYLYYIMYLNSRFAFLRNWKMQNIHLYSQYLLSASSLKYKTFKIIIQWTKIQLYIQNTQHKWYFASMLFRKMLHIFVRFWKKSILRNSLKEMILTCYFCFLYTNDISIEWIQ